MKKKYKYFIIFIIFSLITFLYSFYIFEPNCDEIWNYGFIHSIYTGLIPYKDFNMIIPPLFSFCALPFIHLLGDNLMTFHIYTSIVLGLTMMFMYKKIGNKALIVYPIIILAYLPTYNMFCIFLFSILIFINDKELKNKDIFVALIISFMFLTKQTIGICLFIPCLIYSKNKLKTIISFLIPILIFTIYLIINNALYEFIDYCFLGMFSFAEKNGTITINSIITFLLCGLLLYKLIKSNFKKQHYFYAMMFQVMALPMGDQAHFYTALSIVVYTLLIDVNIPKIIYIYLLIFIYTTVSLIKIINCMTNNYQFNIYKEKDLYYGRNINNNIINYMNNYKQSLDFSEQIGYDNIYVFSKNAYFLKLSQNQKLNKFDLINNGNMGIKSHNGYLEEIKNTCIKKECIFIIENYENREEEIGQTNIELLNYPKDNYELKYKTGQFDIYKNDKMTVK